MFEHMHNMVLLREKMLHIALYWQKNKEKKKTRIDLGEQALLYIAFFKLSKKIHKDVICKMHWKAALQSTQIDKFSAWYKFCASFDNWLGCHTFQSSVLISKFTKKGIESYPITLIFVFSILMKVCYPWKRTEFWRFRIGFFYIYFYWARKSYEGLVLVTT